MTPGRRREKPGRAQRGAPGRRRPASAAPYTSRVDFELTAEQREVQATVRQFVDDRVLPNAIENDINHHLDMSVIEGMADLGLLGIVVPDEYGGGGGGVVFVGAPGGGE